MKGCLTDISCIRYLFQAALEEFPDESDTDDVTDMMGHINKLLFWQYPTESQLDAYHVQVQAYRKIVRKIYGEAFMLEHKHKLQFAGGSESRSDAMQYKLARAERQSKALSKRVTHKIPATESRILKAIFTCAMLLTTVDAFCFAMIMMGSRKSEIINPDVANFDYEDSDREGYIVQWGTAKERGYKPDSALVSGDESEGDSDVKPPSDYKGPPGFYLRRRVEKPILQVSNAKKIDIDDPANVFSVKDVRTAIHKVRDDWEVRQMLDEGYTPEAIAKAHDKEISKRIRELFPESSAYAEAHRTNRLSSHFLRKLYANYGYLTLGDTDESTFAGWASQYLGWKPSSGLQTSISYSDVEIVMMPPELKPLGDGEKAVQALVQECKADLGCEEAGSDLEDADVWARVRHRRKNKRSFIDLTNADTEVQVRVPFHKRRKQTHSQFLARGVETVRLLGVAGVDSVTKQNLRALGFGADSAREIIDNAPPRVAAGLGRGRGGEKG
jgi:hypothetical protein